MNVIMRQQKQKDIESIKRQTRLMNKRDVSQIFLKWTQLNSSDLLMFTRQRWSYLTFYNLRIDYLIQLETKLQPQDVNIFLGLIQKNLQYLNLSDNLLESQGVCHLSKAQWPMLDVIYLSYNRIGVNSIGKLIRIRNNNFSEIYLNDNKLTVDEIIKILLVPSNNPIYLHLSDNQADQISKDRIKMFVLQKLEAIDIYV